MRHPKDLSRRQFLTRAGGAAIAMPSLAAILAACSKPSSSAPSGGAGEIPIATLENPVTLPVNQAPIAADTPAESGPLVLYNWADYIWKKSVARVRGQVRRLGRPHHLQQHGGGHPEGRERTGHGRRVRADARLPAPTRPAEPGPAPAARADPEHGGQRLAELLQPGPVLRPRVELHRPLHDLHWGVGYRRDRVSDDEAAAQGWEALWNNDYNGAISLYDSYGDTIAITILATAASM